MKKVSETTVCIIHFQPLEMYPPVMNMIDYLGKNLQEKIIVIANKKKVSQPLKEYTSSASNIAMIRTGVNGTGALNRVLNYFLFYMKSFYVLCKYKPLAILYYETLSSWAALVYKKWISKKVKLLVHYHEYITPEEYAQNMRLAKWMHNMETKMYKTSFIWISHTNQVRMQKFKNDESLNNTTNIAFRLLPNYPPASWIDLVERSTAKKNKYKLVYVGALGDKTMYLKEVFNWVGTHPENLELDMHSYNMDREAEKLVLQCNYVNVHFKGSCDYHTLPLILKQYDVGLVMYKPYSENMIHNAPNKVFEYLACGLDVWFSKDMTYTLSYQRDDTFPKIMPIDFSNLHHFDYKAALCRDGLKFEPSVYHCENVYATIEKYISGGL